MDIFEIIILLIFAFGLGFLLYLVLRDPIHTLKTLLRGLKSDNNWRFKILFLPIWGPIWVIDRIFNLKLYINQFEEASISKSIDFSEFDKYIQVETDQFNHIERIIKEFKDEYNPKEYNYSLNGSEILLAKGKDCTIVRIKKNIDFSSFNVLVQYLDNSAPNGSFYNAKGVLLNRIDRSESYFCFVDTAYPLKLIGKTIKNKKIYVDLDQGKERREIIYFNSNIDYFKNFDFEKFDSRIEDKIFKKIEI